MRDAWYIRPYLGGIVLGFQRAEEGLFGPEDLDSARWVLGETH